jgi:TPR repeat protein
MDPLTRFALNEFPKNPDEYIEPYKLFMARLHQAANEYNCKTASYLLAEIYLNGKYDVEQNINKAVHYIFKTFGKNL